MTSAYFFMSVAVLIIYVSVQLVKCPQNHCSYYSVKSVHSITSLAFIPLVEQTVSPEGLSATRIRKICIAQIKGKMALSVCTEDCNAIVMWGGVWAP